MEKNKLNLKTGKIKIETLPRIGVAFLTHIIVLSVLPIKESNMNLEIKMEEWVMNWN